MGILAGDVFGIKWFGLRKAPAYPAAGFKGQVKRGRGREENIEEG